MSIGSALDQLKPLLTTAGLVILAMTIVKLFGINVPLRLSATEAAALAAACLYAGR